MNDTSLTFYNHLHKLLIWWKDNRNTVIGFTRYYSMDEIIIGVWRGKSGTANCWFKRFKTLGFIEKKEMSKPRYFVNIQVIKKYIKKDSIFSRILKLIDEIDSIF